ncbi:MAG: hypothetical protein KGI98_13005 [Euryarchaeota archaeon]|nr:hypothetical protein [Euryarchaeota archaeon]
MYDPSGNYPPPGAPYPPPSSEPYYPPPPGYGAPQYAPPATAPAWAAPPVKRRSRTPIYVAVAAVAVVVLLVLLLLTGVLNLSPSGKNGGGGGGAPTALTYRQALNVANSSLASRGGSTSWQVAFAQMVDPGVVFNQPFWGPCRLMGFSPNGTGLLGQGTAYLWYFTFVSVPFQTTWAHQVTMTVWNDSGTVQVQLDPEGVCSSFAAPLPANLTDSGTAQAQAQLDGGSTFLSAHPLSSVTGVSEMVYLSYPNVVPEWWFSYSSAVPSTPGTYAFSSLTVFLRGDNGHLLRDYWYNGTTTVRSSHLNAYPVTFSVVSSGSSAGSVAYFENLSLSIPSTPLMTTTNLSLALLEPNSTYLNPGAVSFCAPPYTGCILPPAGGGWDALLRSSSANLDIYPACEFCTSWNGFAGSVSVSSGYTLELVSSFPLSGSGDILRAYSYGAATTGQVTL